MKKIKLTDLNNVIEKNRIMVNNKIAKLSSHERRKRYRARSKGEREALDQISIRKWNKAVERGQVRKISDRIWYYDYQDL